MNVHAQVLGRHQAPEANLDNDSAGYIPATLKGYITFSESEKRRWRAQSHFYRPTKNSWEDALSHMAVVELLMKLRPDTTFRARHLPALLDQQFPQIRWDQWTIGRILAELAEMAEENWPLIHDRAIVTGRDFESGWYRINAYHETWAWFRKLRNQIGLKAERQIRAERDGQAKIPGSPWNGLDTGPA